MEEFVFDFTEDGSMHPIEVVADITGLTYDEIRSCSDTMKVDYDPEDGYSYKIYENASSDQG
ncbi:MAG: hypothetical protein VYB44_07310 [Bacteroidota bacterium]|nr:hypothetical protein [Bacteroidota bacterium]